MNIVVCVKQVPDTQSLVTVAKSTGLALGPDQKYVASECDLIAVKWACEQKAKNNGIAITVVCLGEPSAEKVLRQCIALGADRTLLLQDSAFEGSDGYATGMILARAIEMLEYDIVNVIAELTASAQAPDNLSHAVGNSSPGQIQSVSRFFSVWTAFSASGVPISWRANIT